MPIVEFNKPKLIVWLAIGLFVLVSGLNNADAQTVTISQGGSFTNTVIDVAEGEEASFQLNVSGGVIPPVVNLRFAEDLGAFTGSLSGATGTSRAEGEGRLVIVTGGSGGGGTGDTRTVVGLESSLAPRTVDLQTGGNSNFSVTPVDDRIAAEGVRTMTIEVVDGDGYDVGAGSLLTINVSDNDISRVRFSQGATGTVNESETIELIVTQDLVADRDTAVNVDFTYDSEDNAFFGDRPTTRIRVDFPAGMIVERSISIPTDNDDVATADGLLTARIVPVSPLRAGNPSVRAVTVLDNEPKVGITAIVGGANNLSVTEGGVANLQFNISPAVDRVLRVELRSIGDVGALTGAPSSDMVDDIIRIVTVPSNLSLHPVDIDIIEDEIAVEGIRIANIVVVGGDDYNADTTADANTVEISVEDDDTAQVSFSQSGGMVNEGDLIELIVTQNLAADTPTAVDINFTYDGDFFESQPMTARAEFPAGEAMSTYSIDIPTDDDGVAEEDGSLRAEITIIPPVKAGTIIPGSPLQAGIPNIRTITVLDNEPDVSVTTLNREVMLSVNEDVGSATLLLTIDPPVDRQLPVTLSYMGDVGALTGELTSANTPEMSTIVMVPANVATHTFVVNVIDDQIVAEFTRTANIVVVEGGSYNVGTDNTVALAVIDDDVAAVSFSQSTGTVIEGESIVLIVTQDLVADTNTAVNIDFTYEGTFFENEPQTVRVKFPADVAGGTTMTTITTMNDEEFEADGSLIANIAIIPEFPLRAGTISSRTVTVLDNDVVVSITAITQVTISESDDIEARLTLSNSLTHDLPVNLGYTGIAEPATPNVVIVPAGETQYDFTASVDDTVAVQPERTITISVEDGSLYTVLDDESSTATFTVTDDDIAVVHILPVSETVIEGDDAVFRLVLDRKTATDLFAEIRFSGIGAFSQALLENREVTISEGGSSALVAVTTDDDQRLEADGTLVATLVNATAPLVLGEPLTGTITVRDNDLAVSITIPGADNFIEVPEDIGSVTVRVDVNREVSDPLPITLRYTGDRGALTGDLSSVEKPDRFRVAVIPAGGRSQTVTFPVIEDLIAAEGTRIGRVELVDEVGSYFVSPASSVVEIAVTDNDVATVSVIPVRSTVTEDQSVLFEVTQNLVANKPTSIDFRITRVGDFFASVTSDSISQYARSGAALDLGTDTASGISLSLRQPVITDDGKVYYFLDSGSDALNGLLVTHDELDDLLNNGDDTIDTQSDGHDGNPDERSVIVGNYVLILPTIEEYQALYQQFGNTIDWETRDSNLRINGRDLSPYCSSALSFRSVNNHATFLFNNGETTSAADTQQCFVAFQVQDVPDVITVNFPADEAMSTTIVEVQIIDDSVADTNGAVFVKLVARDDELIRPADPPVNRARVVIQDNDFITVSIVPVRSTVAEGEVVEFDVIRELFEGVEATEVSIDLRFTVTGQFSDSIPIVLQAAFGNLLDLGTDETSGLSLQLDHPVTLDNGKVYYILDRDGNGEITDDDRVLNSDLGSLLNNGSIVRPTQALGHNGRDDERSVIVDDYTLILPTANRPGVTQSGEYFAIYNQFGGSPAAWVNNEENISRTYCTATTDFSENSVVHSYAEFSTFYGTTNDNNTRLCFAVFQVLDVPVTVRFPADITSTRVAVVQTIDDGTAETDGLVSASVITGLGIRSTDLEENPVTTVIQDDDFMMISFRADSPISEGDTAQVFIIQTLPENSENLERSIDLMITTMGNFFPSPYLGSELKFPELSVAGNLLDLILPLTVDGVRYYFLDVNRDGMADTGDMVTPNALDTLLNNGNDTIKTQGLVVLADGSRRYIGHDGSDDERSVISSINFDDYTLVLPIEEQFTLLAGAYRNNVADWPWPIFNYCSSESVDSNTHFQYQINTDVRPTEDVHIRSELADNGSCYVIFEVVRKRTVDFPEGSDTALIEIETSDDPDYEVNGLISVVASPRDPLLVRSGADSAADRGIVVVSDNDSDINVTALDGTGEITVAEGSSFRLRINSDPPLSQAVAVALNYLDISNVLSDDVPTMVTVPANATSHTFEISLNDDQLTAQSIRSPSVRVVAGPGYQAVASIVSILVTDNDFATVNISSQASEIEEGNPVVFDFSLSLVPAEPVDVEVTLEFSGEPDNFFTSEQTEDIIRIVTFEAGKTEVSTSVGTADDTLPESIAVLEATITDVPDSLRIGTQSSSTVTIVSNDIRVGITDTNGASSVTLKEADDSVTLRLNMPVRTVIETQVNLRYEGEGALDLIPSFVTVPADLGEYEFDVFGIDNMIAVQSTYDITVFVDDGFSYRAQTNPAGADQVTLTVTNDNDTATATISPARQRDTITEGEDAVFEIMLDNEVAVEASIDVDFVSKGEFFNESQATSVTATISMGSSSVRVTVETDDDGDGEEDGYLVATLRRLADSPLLVGEPRTSTITILDNESVVSITTLAGDSAAPIDESDTSLRLTIDPVSDRELQVNLGYSGKDGLLPTVVTVPADSTSHVFSINLDDMLGAQGTYVIDISVDDGLGYQRADSGADQVTLTVSDDDIATVNLSSLRDVIAEGEDAVFELSVSVETAIDVSAKVSLTFMDDPTRQGSTSVLTFAAGETTARIIVPTEDNDFVEGDGVLIANLVSVSAPLVIGNAQSTILIRENDIKVSVTAMDGSDHISVAESAGSARLLLHIDPPIERVLSVNLLLTGDPGALTGEFTADGTEDITRMIEVPGGVSTLPFEIQIEDDYIAAESTRTARVVVAAGSYRSVGNPVAVDVVDNDVATVTFSPLVNTLTEGSTVVFEFVQDLPTDVETSVVLTFRPIGDVYLQQSLLKPSTLNFFVMQGTSTINLSLILPSEIRDGPGGSLPRVLYFLDQNDDGMATADDVVTLQSLGDLLNPGSLPVQTQEPTVDNPLRRHDGSDDGRSVIVGDYTLVLPDPFDPASVDSGLGGDIALNFHPQWYGLNNDPFSEDTNYCTPQPQSVIDDPTTELFYIVYEVRDDGTARSISVGTTNVPCVVLFDVVNRLVVRFPAGIEQSTTRVEIQTVNDEVAEVDGSVGAALVQGSMGPLQHQLGGLPANVTIFDNESVVGITGFNMGAEVMLRRFAAATVSTNLVLILSSTDNRRRINLSYEDDSGSLISMGAPSFVEVPAGVSSRSFPVAFANNGVALESSQSVSISVASGDGYTVSTSNRTVDIFIEEKDVLTVSIAPLTDVITEGENAVFEITHDLAVATDTSIELSFTSSGAFFDDLPDSIIVNIPAGLPGNITRVEVPTTPDSTPEVHGSLMAELVRSTDNRVIIAPENQSALITILDNDIPEVTMISAPTTITEGTPIVVELKVNFPSVTPRTYFFDTEIDPAGSDFFFGSLNAELGGQFAADATESMLTLTTREDGTSEANALLTLTFRSEVTDGLPELRFVGVYGSIPAPQITIAILDNETIIGITTPDGADETMVMATADATTLLLTRSSGLNEGDAEVGLLYIDADGYSVDALTPTVVTMPAGNTTYAFSVSGLNNMLVAQPTRNINVEVTNGLFHTRDERNRTVMITVINDNTATVSILPVNSTVTEGNPAVFEVVSELATAEDITVRIDLSLGGDFITEQQRGNTTIIIPEGQMSGLLTVPTLDNADGDADAPLVATLIEVMHPALEIGVASSTTVTILNNESVVSITTLNDRSVGTITETDGDSTTLRLTVTPPSPRALQVNLGYSVDGLLPTVVTVPANASSHRFNITGIDDMLAQTMNQRSIEIFVAEGLGYAVSPDESAVILTIAEDDIVALRILPVRAMISEGEDAVFALMLNFVAETDVSATISFTATGDFLATTPVDTEIIFTAGETSMLLTVATVDDAETEPDGSLVLQVEMQSAGTGQRLGDAVTSAISILDNESLVTLERHNRHSYSVNEGRGAATLRLHIDPPVSRELAVNLRYTGDTGALAGTIEAVGDMTGRVIVPAGTSRYVFDIPVVDDRIAAEFTRRVDLAVAAGIGYTAASASLTLEVTDNDVATVSIAPVKDTLTNGEDIVFEITQDLATYTTTSIVVDTEGNLLVQSSPNLNYGTVADINLNLILPTILNDKVYYFLDYNGDGIASTADQLTQRPLNNLLNNSERTIVTQEFNHDGSDDERSIVLFGSTLILPTAREYREINRQNFGVTPQSIPPGWLIDLTGTNFFTGRAVNIQEYAGATTDLSEGAFPNSYAGFTFGDGSPDGTLTIYDVDDLVVTAFQVINPSAGLIPIPAGAALSRTQITIPTDGTVGGNSSVTATLRLPDDSPLALGSPNSAVVTLLDNQVFVSVSVPADGTDVTDVEVSEGDGSVELQLNINPSIPLPLSVNLLLSADHGALSGALSAPATEDMPAQEMLEIVVDVPIGAESVRFFVPVDDDEFAEHARTAAIRVETGLGYTASTVPVTITVIDDDVATVNLAQTGGAIVEGDVIVYEVSKYPVVDVETSVVLSFTQNGSEDFFDSVPTSHVFTFPAREVFSTGRLELQTLDDDVSEDAGSLVATLSVTTSMSTLLQIGSRAMRTVTIQDNDTEVGVTSIIGGGTTVTTIGSGTTATTTTTIIEGDTTRSNTIRLLESSGTVTLQLNINPIVNRSLDVALRFTGDIEGINPDFPENILVTVPSGRSTHQVNIPIADDKVSEFTDRITVMVESGTDYTATASTVLIIIEDEDFAEASISLADADATLITEGETIVFVITQDLATEERTRIDVVLMPTGDFFTDPGLATSEDNPMVRATRTITFPANTPNSVVPVIVRTEDDVRTAEDDTAEAAEEHGILLAEIVANSEIESNASLVRIADEPENTREVRILDNDIPIMNILSASTTVTEGEDIVFVFGLDPLPNVTVGFQVDYVVTPSDADFFTGFYEPVPTELPIAGDQRSRVFFNARDETGTLTIQTVNDDNSEADASLEFIFGVILRRVGSPSVRFIGVDMGITELRRTVAVLDNDLVVGITSVDGDATARVSEDDGSVELQLNIAPTVDRELLVNVRYTGDVGALTGALSSDTVDDIRRVVTVPANASSHRFDVPVVDDDIAAESTRTANIMVDAGDRDSYIAASSPGNSVALMIEDNDIAKVILYAEYEHGNRR